MCTVGESPSTCSPPTKDPAIPRTPTTARIPGSSLTRKRKLLNRDSLPAFRGEPEAEYEVTETKDSSKPKRKRNSRESKPPPGKKAKDTPHISALSGLGQRPRTRSGGRQSSDSIGESERNGSRVTLKEKDRNSLKLFDAPKKWRQPQEKPSAARRLMKSAAGKGKRKTKEERRGGRASLDDQWKVPGIPRPAKGEKRLKVEH